MTRIRLSLVTLLAAYSFVNADDWTQWRGPDRSNVSKEKGLLNEWPKDGPPLSWKAVGLGDGVAPVSVVGGRVFTMGNKGDDVICTAFSERDGVPLWTAKIGPAAKEIGSMRWLSQMAPTVDGEQMYVVIANGDYVCLATETGKEIWRKHFQKDFEGRRGPWGFCDYPLVDGENLIISPGGQKATVVALNKKTGERIWACAVPGGDTHGHAAPMIATIGGTRQYVFHLAKWMVGVSAREGELLWKYDGMGTRVATTHAPIIRDDTIFYASGYLVGHALLKAGNAGGTWKITEVYRLKSPVYLPWLGSPTALSDGVLFNTTRGLQWVDWKTGKVAWEDKTLGRCTYTVADDKIFVRTQSGKIALGTADAKGWKPLAEFVPPALDSSAPASTFPVVANGRLYVRDYDALLCYDVRDPKQFKRKFKPDAVFIPTPEDVVKVMLDQARVRKEDVVYDLGSGDGRIVIAAAKTRGCRAVGVELEEELVEKARDAAREAGVEKLARFEHGDLFDADFSSATVVALYILPTMSQKLIPKLDKLKPGSRIVSHEFAIPGLKPDRAIKFTSTEDDVERPVYLYTVPLKRESLTGK